MSEYIANGGQTYIPIQENVNVDFMPFQHPKKPNPLLAKNGPVCLEEQK